MDEARYWMWAKPKPPPASSIYAGDSWEEQAFADDTAGALGGCVWPPRFYSCSFCRRDFRSAQALGGHMNVHRRDRARLKQSPNPRAELGVTQNHASNPCTSLDQPFSSQMCSFFFKNPNPQIRVLSPPPADKVRLVSMDHCPPPPPWSNFLSEKRGCDDEEKSVVVTDLESRADQDSGLDLSVCHWQTDKEEEVGGFKRRRVEVKPLSFLVERCLPQPEVLKLCSVGSGADDLDLELRLGVAPKVK